MVNPFFKVQEAKFILCQEAGPDIVVVRAAFTGYIVIIA